MFNSPVVGESGRVSVRRSAFSHTCALLGQFVKEKKAFGDLNFDMTLNVDSRGSNIESGRTTMNLFPVNERFEEMPTSGNDKPASPFSHNAGSIDVYPNSREIESAPMTIFYAGKVMVLDDLPAQKAKMIMELASLGISQNPNATARVVDHTDNMSDNSITRSMLNVTSLVPPTLNHQIQEPAQKLTPVIINDLPLTRKNSLLRFMGKRKERIAAKAPYNMGKPGDAQSNSKPNDGNSWLGLAATGSGLL